MNRIAQDSSGDLLHALTGIFAILLMMAHAIWATYVIVKKDKNQMERFTKFSIVVWVIWLVPYFSGVIAGLNH